MKLTFEVSEAIRSNKARYCRFVDTKQWDELAKLALPETTYTFFDVAGEPLYQFASTQAWLKVTTESLEGAHTSHRVCNSELSMISDSKVAAIWAMEDYLIFKPENGKPSKKMHGYGHYHETWERRGDDWFLSKLELKRTILEFSGG